MRDRSRAAAREFELLRSSQHPEQPPRLARRSARRMLRRKPPKKCSAAKYRCCTVPRPLPGPPGGTAPARAPGGAGFKGQRPLRTVSPPFNLCLALIGLASIRSLLPRFGCTFVLAMISSVLSDFSVFFLLRRLLLEWRPSPGLYNASRARRGERSPMISMFVIGDEFWCRICAGWNLRWVKQLGGL